MTKMRFGTMAGQGGASWQEIADMWRFLDRETLFQSVWVFDHFVSGDPAGDMRGPCFEGWTSLAALATLTERVRLGVLVTGVTYRNPAVLAKMALTVDHISNGRLDFGIGAGWHEPEHRMYGIPFPPPRERSDRLEEALQVIRLLFDSEGPVSFEGKHYRLDGAIFDPPAVQRPHPPLLIGGGGEKRTLRTVARYADAMNVSGTPEQVRRKIEIVDGYCREIGRDPAEIEKTSWGAVVVTENEGLIDRIVRMTAPAAGISVEEAKRIMPVGTPAHVRGVVEEYAKVGVTRMIMMSQPPWKRDIYRRLNDEVLAAFA
jgi:F420-dependent oxidoreductase-like protein